jgi:hypothetical protein
MERSLAGRSEDHRSLWHTVKRLLRDDLEAWGLTRSGALAITLMPIVSTLAFIAAIPFPALFLWLIDEDSLLEWLQFACILAASLLFALLSVRLFRGGRRGVGLLYLLLTLGAFFIAGEEISWGQRILGIRTPEALEAINAQQEISVHNIFGFHQLFIYATVLGGMYGIVGPLVRLAFSADRPRSRLSYLLIPPLCLIPAFFMPFGYRLSRLLIQPELYFPDKVFIITEFSELTELCMYFALLVFAWLNLRRLRQASEQDHR